MYLHVRSICVTVEPIYVLLNVYRHVDLHSTVNANWNFTLREKYDKSALALTEKWREEMVQQVSKTICLVMKKIFSVISETCRLLAFLFFFIFF